ncbi:hypothetical protein COCON_G00019780 [Conger conger]|uniref:Keratinocyte differentiation factor 1 n=1 Tax=Conger conger TaxID=82655 RepID=A0A9Q1I951_CONCO|nr:hypothetical protein COCON_G00019780 [Conger conger]
MPGNSAGSPQKPRPQAAGRSGGEGHRSGEGHRRSRTQSRDSSTSQESSREPCLEPLRMTDPPPLARRAAGRDSESLGFIPGSADSAPAVRSCGPCTPPRACRTTLCCILTCGLYGPRPPCLSPPRGESSTDPPASPAPQARPPNGVAVPSAAVRQEPPPSRLPASDSFRYGDVRIGGKKVEYPAGPPPRRPRAPRGESQRPVSNTSMGSVYSRDELDFLDDLSDSGTDIDSLITKKLLELYKLHQIDQLAKCTSDSSFSRKTNEISDLIYSIAQDYNLETQEAECRLVHGVIRISTRKSKRAAPRPREPANPPLTAPNGRRDGTLPDSGNETMTDTFYSNDTEPEVKVSQQTPSDALARQMRMSSGPEFSGPHTAYSPGPQDTETDSSGTPLLHYLRT